MSSAPEDQLLRALESGDYGRALHDANAVLQQDPTNATAWRVIGQVRLFQGLHGEARECGRRAVSADGTDPDAHLLLAYVHNAGGRTNDAIERCDAALSRDPGHERAAVAKASFLERAGRASEALATLEEIDDEPLSAAIVRIKALLSEGEIKSAIDHAESALHTGARPRYRYQLLMLRAKALDRLGRYDEAFESARAGRAVASEASDGDPSQYVRRAKAAMNTYTRDALASMPVNPASDRSDVFIAGFARSGTTLVEQILDAHPDAVGVGEAKEIDMLTRGLQQLTGAFVEFPECAKYAEPTLLQQMASDYTAAMDAHGHDVSLKLVNKNLQNLLLVGFIAQLFPKARFILTQRDPRDVAVSCFMSLLRPEAMPHLSSMEHIAASLRAARELRRHWLETLPERTLLVRYEDLVRDPEHTMRRLTDFAGLPWDERCLRFHESDRTVTTLSYDQVTRPIYDSSIGRYRNYESRLGPAAELTADD
jgi:tetratricopeptide (TPR) repeat protein